MRKLLLTSVGVTALAVSANATDFTLSGTAHLNVADDGNTSVDISTAIGVSKTFDNGMVLSLSNNNMANATVSFLGKANNSGDDNALFLKLFSGEVLAAFAKENKMLPMTMVRSISQGKRAQFPVFGKAAASEYHTPGNEITGQVIKQNEKIITIDDLLISHSFISELDEAKAHFDYRSIYSKEMGEALAKTIDQHLLQLVVLAARGSATVTG